MRGQLVSAISDIESFRLGSQQAVEARLRESLEWHEKLANERMTLMEGAISGMVQRLESAFSTQEELLVHLRDSGGETVMALRSVSKRLAAIKAPEDLIERKLEQTMTKIGSVIETFEAAAASELERQRNVAGASQTLRDVVSQLGQELTRAREQVEAFGRVSQPSEALATTLVRMTENVEKIGTAIATQQATLQDAARQAQQAQQMLIEGLGTSQVALRGLEDQIAQAGGHIVVGAAQLGHHLREAGDAVASQRDSIRESVADAARAREQIAEDLVASRSAVAELQRLLTDAARTVASAMIAPPGEPTHG